MHLQDSSYKFYQHVHSLGIKTLTLLLLAPCSTCRTRGTDRQVRETDKFMSIYKLNDSIIQFNNVGKCTFKWF